MYEPKLSESNGWYNLRFYNPDTRKRKSVALHTKDRREAKRRARAIAQRYKNGDFDPWGDPKSDRILSELIEEFLLIKKKHLKQSSYKSVLEVLLPFKEAFGGRMIDTITAVEISDFIWRKEKKEPSHQTVKRRLVTVKSFFRYCNKQGYVIRSPLLSMRAPTVREQPPNYLTQSEFALLLSKIEELQPGDYRSLMKSLVLFAVSTGIRRGSIVELIWDDINTETQLITVPKKTAKTDGYCIPIMGMAREALMMRIDSRPYVFSLDGSPLKADWITYHFGQLVELAGLKDITFHSLRHTFASWLVQRGVPIHQVSKWMGHSSVIVTERYAYLEPTDYSTIAEEALDHGTLPTRKRQEG